MRQRPTVTRERCACPAKYERVSHRRDPPISVNACPYPSTAFGHLNKSRFSSVCNGVEPDESFQTLADLLYRALRKRCDIEVLADARGRNGSRANRAAAQNTPGQEHLRGSLSMMTGDRDNKRVVEQSRFQRVPQRSERQQDDAL